MNAIEKYLHLGALITKLDKQINTSFDEQAEDTSAKSFEEWIAYRSELSNQKAAAKRLKQHYEDLISLNLVNWD